MKKLKIAVVGIGLGGKLHIACMKNNPNVVLDSIIAPEREENQKFAKNENVPIYHSIEDCIRERRLDGVIIASPNRFHISHAMSCVNAGIPALLEKPVTSSLQEGEELKKIVDNAGAKILVGHHRAHSPILKSAINVIKQGRLGSLVSVMGSAQFHKPAHYFVDGPWRKGEGGGPILINLIHEIDSLRRLVGEIEQVQSIASNRARGFLVEDTVCINMVFANGALGSFMLSDVASTPRSWEQTSGENLKYPSFADEDCYLIAGTKGSLSIPTMRLKYYPDGQEPSWWVPFAEEVFSFSKRDPMDMQLQNFVEVIRGEAVPVVTLKDGYENLLVIEAIKKSSKTGCAVYVH